MQLNRDLAGLSEEEIKRPLPEPWGLPVAVKVCTGYPCLSAESCTGEPQRSHWKTSGESIFQRGPYPHLHFERHPCTGPDGRVLWRSPRTPKERASAGDQTRQRPMSMLTDFIRAGTRVEGLSENVESYASRWGVLGICEHGLPASHNPHRLAPDMRQFRLGGYRGVDHGCYPQDWGRKWSQEPLGLWVWYAVYFEAILEVVAALRVETANYADTIASLRDRVPDSIAENLGLSDPGDRELHRAMVGWRIGEMHQIGNVQMGIGHAHDGGLQVVEVAGLFGQLVYQLALVVTGTRACVRCAGCAEWFEPTRMPRGPRSWCQKEACQLESGRQRQRTSAAKKRSNTDGVTLPGGENPTH